MDFVHLHLHTTYSLLDGQCQIKPLVAKAKALGMGALAVTDHGNLFALKAFYDECRRQGVKPILGCEAYVTSGDHTGRDKNEHRFHLCLHAKNLAGYHNLVRLISEAHIHGFYYHPRIDHRLLEKYHEGLHCSSACIAGEIAYYLDDKGGNDSARAEEIARWYQGLFGDDYSLEVMLHRSTKRPREITDPLTGEIREQITLASVNEMAELYQRQLQVTDRVLALGQKLGIRVIATNDVHFLEREDDDSHDVLLALSTGTKLSDTRRMIYTGEEYFKTPEEMLALFPEHPELLAATQAVADRVEEYELDSDPIMPKFPIPASFGTEAEFQSKYDEPTLEAMYPAGRMAKFGGYAKTIRIQFEAEYLASLVWTGAERRWGAALDAEKRERLQFELDTIRTMGFPGYFLIVNDYIASARRMGVWVGPGRGSAAGSAVAYALGITNVDPLKFDLLFERFLNPDRISMPDIDVDFDDAGRGKVLEYVTEKYGQDHVAHIVTFGQMAAKSVIKDVGRVMGYPLPDTNKLASYVPETPKITFAKAEKESPDLKAAFESEDETVRTLMTRARRLEGGMRQPGVHACGVIISRDPLIETLPVMPTEGESLLTTQYDGHFVEPVGLLKMDFLGLKTLTVEKECVEILGANNPRVPPTLRDEKGYLDPDKIPDDDPETYALFGRGETTGLFQFESDGMKKWLKALQPEKLTDLVAMNALYRPGPMEYIPAFVRRKQGEEPITYDHPLMEKYLKDTYGVCVYQEQVMLLSRQLGGFSRGDSDKLRKAMGKKQLAVMEQLKVKFVEGCLANPAFRIGQWADEAEARKLIDKIWDDWRAFASYAFNKSHAVCYAWIAYQTGYLKAHYPAEFMCAQISSEIGNFDKLPGFVAEAQGMNLQLRLPDVNESGARFVPTPDAHGIRYGLSGIKGVGNAGEVIVEERRRGGPYKGFLDFCVRLGGTQVANKRVLENLARTGAFSAFGENRRRYFDNIEFALKLAQRQAKEKASAQTSFFELMGEGGDEFSDAELAPAPEATGWENLQNERDYLGVYISGDPLGPARRFLGALTLVQVDRRGEATKPLTLRELVKREGAEETDADGGEAQAAKDGEDEQLVEKLLMKSTVRDWPFKGLLKKALKAQDLMEYAPEAKAVEVTLRKHTDKRLLKKLDLRLIGMLVGCTEKTSKYADRETGEFSKWAILDLDDGTAHLEGMAFSRVWTGARVLAERPDALVYLAGEYAHRTVYAKEDAKKMQPAVGELAFTIREAYPLEEALPLVCKAMEVRLAYDGADTAERLERLKTMIDHNPGQLPVVVNLGYPDGRVVEISLGKANQAAVNMAFLSELDKYFTPAQVRFRLDSRIYLKE